jgi:hypothetical protein
MCRLPLPRLVRGDAVIHMSSYVLCLSLPRLVRGGSLGGYRVGFGLGRAAIIGDGAGDAAVVPGEGRGRRRAASSPPAALEVRGW